MIGRIIDIAENNRYLSVYRGFMLVRSGDNELGRIPLDQIDAVIVSGHGITHSSNLLAALAERGVPFVYCNDHHRPVGMLLSVDGHYHQGKRMQAQLNAQKPLRKRLWKSIVKAKILFQAAVLESLGKPCKPLLALEKKVRSGDPENIEAQAARVYWPRAFGKQFRRDRSRDGANALLNFGYTIIRSATARSVIATGLHPGAGLHHHNAYNPMPLVDDLMEPFRPFIDIRVLGILDQELNKVDSNTKPMLASVLRSDLQSNAGITPLAGCMHKLASSLAYCYLGEKTNLEFPHLPQIENIAAMRRVS